VVREHPRDLRSLTKGPQKNISNGAYLFYSLKVKTISNLDTFPTAYFSEKNTLVLCSLNLKATMFNFSYIYLYIYIHTYINIYIPYIFMKTMEQRVTNKYLWTVVAEIVQ
jgi:hypothetical protein